MTMTDPNRILKERGPGNVSRRVTPGTEVVLKGFEA